MNPNPITRALRFGALLLFCAATPVHAEQSAEALMAAHAEAMGGESAMAAVEHVLRIGKMTVSAGGGEPLAGDLKSMVVPRQKVYRDTALGMFSSTAGWDGEVAWEKSRMGIRELAGDELQRLVREADIFFTTGLWLPEHVQTEVLEQSSIDGKPHHVVRYFSADWDGITVYFDPDTMLVTQVSADMVMPGATGPSNVVTRLGDYETVEGVAFPNFISIAVPGLFSSEIRYSRTIVNGPVYDPIFAKPEPGQ